VPRTPELRNRDGDEIVFHELVYQVPDHAVAAAALDAHPEVQASGDGEYVWTRDIGAFADTIVANLALDGDRLSASVNSDERLGMLTALLDVLVPGAVLVDHDHRSLAEAMRDRRHDDDDEDSEPSVDPNDPEIQALLRTMMEDYERRWVDEPVPALDGLTPREAVGHPIQRPELERLLADMEARSSLMDGGGMSAERVRRLLNL
jgi:hypothetical protein